jgi:hypothetical protein
MAKETTPQTAADIIKALKASNKKDFADLVLLSDTRTANIKDWIC